MNELIPNEIIRLWYGRAPGRRIAKTLAINRKKVDRILKEHKAARKSAGAFVAPPRPSILDPFRENNGAVFFPTSILAYLRARSN
jgi:hypothetical protein